MLMYFCNYDCITKAYNEKDVLLHVPPLFIFHKDLRKICNESMVVHLLRNSLKTVGNFSRFRVQYIERKINLLKRIAGYRGAKSLLQEKWIKLLVEEEQI